jgi:hypothetical protein
MEPMYSYYIVIIILLSYHLFMYLYPFSSSIVYVQSGPFHVPSNLHVVRRQNFLSKKYYNVNSKNTNVIHKLNQIIIQLIFLPDFRTQRWRWMELGSLSRQVLIVRRLFAKTWSVTVTRVERGSCWSTEDRSPRWGRGQLIRTNSFTKAKKKVQAPVFVTDEPQSDMRTDEETKKSRISRDANKGCRSE